MKDVQILIDSKRESSNNSSTIIWITDTSNETSILAVNFVSKLINIMLNLDEIRVGRYHEGSCVNIETENLPITWSANSSINSFDSQSHIHMWVIYPTLYSSKQLARQKESLNYLFAKKMIQTYCTTGLYKLEHIRPFCLNPILIGKTINDSKGLVSYTAKDSGIDADLSTAPCWMKAVVFGISSSEDCMTPCFMRDQRLENDCARQMFALLIAYCPFLVGNFASTPFKDFADVFEYLVDIAAKNNLMFKKKLKMAYKIAGDEVMHRLSKANVSRPREMWDAISMEFANFYRNEYSVIGGTLLAGLGYYVKEIVSIATQYKVTYWCHLILTGEGGSGKTHLLLYLCRALMTTDLRMKLALGKELSRSKDALIYTCRIYDEHFSTVPKK